MLSSKGDRQQQGIMVMPTGANAHPLARRIVNDATWQHIALYLDFNPPSFSLPNPVFEAFKALLLAFSLPSSAIFSLRKGGEMPGLLLAACDFSQTFMDFLNSPEKEKAFADEQAVRDFLVLLNQIFSHECGQFVLEKMDTEVVRACENLENLDDAHMQSIKAFMQKQVIRYLEAERGKKNQTWSDEKIKAFAGLQLKDNQVYIRLFKAFMLATVGVVQQKVSARLQAIRGRGSFLKAEQEVWQRGWQAFQDFMCTQDLSKIPIDASAQLAFFSDLLLPNSVNQNFLVSLWREKIPFCLKANPEKFLKHVYWQVIWQTKETDASFDEFWAAYGEALQPFMQDILARVALGISAPQFVPSKMGQNVGETAVASSTMPLLSACRHL